MGTYTKSTCSERVCTDSQNLSNLQLMLQVASWSHLHLYQLQQVHCNYTTCSFLQVAVATCSNINNLQLNHFFESGFCVASSLYKWLILLQVVKSCKSLILLQVVDFVASGLAAMGMLQLVKLQVASSYHLQQSHLQHQIWFATSAHTPIEEAREFFQAYNLL